MSHSATVPNTTTAFRPLDSTSVLRPTRLLCPDCKRSGSESVLACLQVAKIEFHHCRGCGGAWFYEKVMDEALRATGEHEWPEPVPAPAAIEKQSPDVKVEHPWACPCCGGNLVGVNDRRGSGATVHRCLVCYGGFIEHNDLLLAAEASVGMLARLGSAIRTIWTRQV
jgi:hypothetical protein